MNETKVLAARTIWQRHNEWTCELKPKVGCCLFPCYNYLGLSFRHDAWG